VPANGKRKVLAGLSSGDGPLSVRGAPPPSRAPEDPFKPLRRKHLRDPPLSGGASAPPPVRNQEPGRSLPGPDAGHPLHTADDHGGYQPSCAPADDVPVACPIGRSTPGTHGHSQTARYTGSPACRQADPLRKPTFQATGRARERGCSLGCSSTPCGAVQGRPPKRVGPALNRSEHQPPELLMRLGPASHCQGQGSLTVSHGLTGRYWTMASMPDTWQDADLPIRIPAHGSDTLH
jgi:hypothetical protein